jgi:hypothetical protein
MAGVAPAQGDTYEALEDCILPVPKVEKDATWILSARVDGRRQVTLERKHAGEKVVGSILALEGKNVGDIASAAEGRNCEVLRRSAPVRVRSATAVECPRLLVIADEVERTKVGVIPSGSIVLDGHYYRIEALTTEGDRYSWSFSIVDGEPEAQLPPLVRIVRKLERVVEECSSGTAQPKGDR